MNRSALGADGERMAADCLAGLGIEIVEKNFRRKTGEIDLIAREGDVWAFVEVKRRLGGGARPGEAVNRKKQRRIVLTALTYLHERGLTDVRFRFDVAEVRGEDVAYMRNAFDATDMFN